MNSRLLGEQSHLKLSYRVFLLHEFHMRSCFFLKWVSSQHPIGTNPEWILSAVSVKDCLIQRRNLTASCTVVEVDTYLVADGAHGLWESECEGGSAWPPCSGHPKTIATSTVADQYHTAVTQQLLVTSKYTITEAKKTNKKNTHKKTEDQTDKFACNSTFSDSCISLQHLMQQQNKKNWPKTGERKWDRFYVTEDFSSSNHLHHLTNVSSTNIKISAHK